MATAESPSIDGVADRTREAVDSEFAMELDFDDRAKTEIRGGNLRLFDCLALKLKQIGESSASRGVIKAPPWQHDKEELTISRIATSLAMCTNDAQCGCILSRRFRFEVVAQYILGGLSDLKVDFVRGIIELRRLVRDGKYDPNQRQEYIDNIEMRLANVEQVYEEVFGAAFDAENADGDDEQSGEVVTRRLNNLVNDLRTVNSRVNTRLLQESDYLGRLAQLTAGMATDQTEIARATFQSECSSRAIESGLKNLSEVIRSSIEKLREAGNFLESTQELKRDEEAG